MEYMLLLHADENKPGPIPGTAEFEAFMGEWMVFNQMLIDGGHWVSGGNLQPSPTATTLRREGTGEMVTLDGPFIETKEQLGGYYLVSAADLDEAMALARKLPASISSVEIRPVAFRPDAN